MWSRQLAEGKTEHQNGDERGFKWLWTWQGCWCQTGWSEGFRNCWQGGIFTGRLLPTMSIPLWPQWTLLWWLLPPGTHKAHITYWFPVDNNEFTVLQRSPVTRTQSTRAPLGCGATVRVSSQMSIHQTCSTCVTSTCHEGPNCLRNALLNVHHEEWTQFWRQKGANLLLARCIS